MILIFGGAYQGKLDYALQRFKLTDEDIYECRAENTELPENKKIIYEIDKWILALVKANINTEQEINKFINQNASDIVICNDISCGVVPMEPELRMWREAVGRALAGLAKHSDEVVRLFCGIPTVIRAGEKNG